MKNYSQKRVDKDIQEGQEILSKEGENQTTFLYERTYEEGDRIVVESSEKNLPKSGAECQRSVM